MRKLGAVALLLIGTSLSPAAMAQTAPPSKSTGALPSEARSRSVSESTLKKVVDHYRKGYRLTFVIASSFDDELPAWRVAAGRNDPNGTVLLGMCNFYGIGGKANRDRGIELLKKVAETGHPDGMAIYGIILRNGDMDHAPDSKEAVKWMKRAADAGSEIGSEQLMLDQTRVLRAALRTEEAVNMLASSAEAGNLSALYELAELKLTGWSQPPDAKLAIGFFERAALGGHVGAMIRLTRIYLNGAYTKRDVGAARRWANAALTTEDPEGIATGTTLMENGMLTGREEKESAGRIWRKLESSTDPYIVSMLADRNASRYRSSDPEYDAMVVDRAIDAARRGVTDAYDTVALALRFGTKGHPIDKEKARAVLQYGVDAMNPYCTCDMADAYRFGYFEPANNDKALQLYIAAAGLGVPRAMTQVANHYADGRGVPRDPKLAHIGYYTAAYAGDTRAMYYLARNYVYGQGVEVSAKDAELWAKQAVGLGEADGNFAMFELCRLGIGRSPSIVEGIPFLREGMKGGGNDCMRQIGSMLIDGTSIPRDTPLGLKYLERGLTWDEDGQTRVTLARYLLNGGPVPRDPDQAFKLATEAADRGNSDGWLMLANMHAFGISVEKNWGDAVDCYSKSISLGNADAMLDLGTHYLTGDTTEKDPDRAIELWTDAANNGNVQATIYLTKLYFGFLGKDQTNEAEGVKWAEKAIELKRPEVCGIAGSHYEQVKDFISARQWLLRGIELGDSNCCNDMGVLYLKGSGVDQSDAEAAKYYRMGHDKGNMLSTANLAWCYENGRGVDKDLDESMRLCQIAADNGEPMGMMMIGKKYIDGIGVIRDFEKGIGWVRQAANAGDPTAKAMIAAATDKGLIK